MKTIILIVIALLSSAPIIAATANDEAEAQITRTLVWPDGTRYVGGVVEGKRSGKGTIFWQDGTRFVGQFSDDMRNGPGTMILPDGTVYTGFFKNDELIDTESTIAASNAGTATASMDDAETKAALGDTKLPMEADSLVAKKPVVMAQVDENDLIAPKQAAVEPQPSVGKEPQPVVGKEPQPVVNKEPQPVVNKEPQPVVNKEPQPVVNKEPQPVVNKEPQPVVGKKPQPMAENKPTPPAPAIVTTTQPIADTTSNPFDADVTEVTETVKADLIETLDLWAAAWEGQNVVQYLENYSPDFVVPGRQSRRTWEALRRTRLARPKYINVDIVYQRFEFVETNVIDVFFRQTYRSDSYSDLTDKVVRMKRQDNSWKILLERSR